MTTFRKIIERCNMEIKDSNESLKKEEEKAQVLDDPNQYAIAWNRGFILGVAFVKNLVRILEREMGDEIMECIELLQVSGKNTKEKVRNKLMEMVEKY